ncbi:MAG TPA: hypothetical protein VL282_00745, partial [Tepidisphaeraceae bacterium]|nr:hypothetical protein [Tepidisphaeraceae bacterium]
DYSARSFHPDPEYQNLAMLYEPSWNGIVEGDPWDAWWIQNSYGPTLCSLPFLQEPFVTFLQNSQDLWFNVEGDGKTPDKNGYVAPDGCLVDAANLKVHYYRQGDGRHDIHDWFMEATAAGVLMQSELLLISRDKVAIEKYLPKLRRSVAFIETRRDPKNNLFLAGPAANLLAPSDGGYKQPDGKFGHAYLTGLSITYIAALDRMIEIEKLAGHNDRADEDTKLRDSAKAALPQLLTDEGYFIRSLDPAGVKHGVFGAAKHGYFESSPNHDAIALRVVDDAQAKRIMAKMLSIPQLRPHDLIIPNYPGYDDMYQEPTSIWVYGQWVNGGHWSTCEARMMLAYNRLGQFEDARKSMKHMVTTFAKPWKMDNPLPDFGNKVWFADRPINITYDAFGPAAGMIRGLFEPIYSADGLTIIPHIPPGITELHQRDPLRLGKKRIFLATVGSGAISSVTINDTPWDKHDDHSVNLPFNEVADGARIVIALGDAKPQQLSTEKFVTPDPKLDELPASASALKPKADRLDRFIVAMTQAKLDGRPEVAHAKLAIAILGAAVERAHMLKSGKLAPLPDAAQNAADESYTKTFTKLFDGLNQAIAKPKDPTSHHQIAKIWAESDAKL